MGSYPEKTRTWRLGSSGGLNYGLLLVAILALSALVSSPAYAGCMKEGPSGPYFEGNAALCPNQGGGQNAQRSHFAAIAISEGDITVWGSSWGWPTKSGAERRALQNCKAKDCKIRMWGEGACIALAESDDAGYWGTGRADSPGGAERDAVGMCQGAAKHPCKVVTHPCSED